MGKLEVSLCQSAPLRARCAKVAVIHSLYVVHYLSSDHISKTKQDAPYAMKHC